MQFHIDTFAAPEHIEIKNFQFRNTPMCLFYNLIIQGVISMPLLSLPELAQELSVPQEYITKLINLNILTPYGGRARLGEPRFSTRNLSEIREKLCSHPNNT